MFESTTPLLLPSPLQLLNTPLLAAKQIRLFVKREDLINPLIGGNKWRKLKYNIHDILQHKELPVLSFGGAYSNHIYALAGAGKLYGFKTIGIIRGEIREPLNRTLAFAKESGMLLSPVTRLDYQLKESPDFIDDLREKFGDFHLLPEGGSNQLALKGCAEIIEELDRQFINGDYDYVCLPCGTAGTLAGIASSQTGKKILGFAVLKGENFLEENVRQLLNNQQCDNWEINFNYHFDGYAKARRELLHFIDRFKRNFDMRIERVYSGKMFYGLFEMIARDYFPKQTTIVALHTGGLQNEIV